MSDQEIKKLITSTFKFSGFTIRAGICNGLVKDLEALTKNERVKLLDNLVDHVQKMGLDSPNIEAAQLEQALRECGNRNLEEFESVFNVINAFDIPKFTYDFDKKKFVLDSTPKRLLADATAKPNALQNRYNMLWQRTQRHEMFTKESLSDRERGVPKFSLKKCEDLMSSSKIREVVVLGLLTQVKDGKIHLEDPTGLVELDLKDAKLHTGLFCEGCYVLAQGKYKENVLQVISLGFPPAENAESSRSYFGTVNTWGGSSKSLLKYSQKLSALELTEVDSTIIFLSDCWLDDPTVMSKLRVLFEGYDDSPPVAIVMMGPFLKENTENYGVLKACFQDLGEIISKCTFIKERTEIVIVPDVDDFGIANILPRPPIPECIVSGLKQRVNRVTLATNPCRIQYCTQQIVVFRMNLTTKLCRNTLKFPETGLIEEHIGRTLVSQGHLAPMHMIPMPIYWNFDHALCLYPLPDLIVLGDATKSFSTEIQGCNIMNVGSFAKHSYSFKVYVPHNKTIEDSAIPNED